jgi:hypothetical protein
VYSSNVGVRGSHSLLALSNRIFIAGASWSSSGEIQLFSSLSDNREIESLTFTSSWSGRSIVRV